MKNSLIYNYFLKPVFLDLKKHFKISFLPPLLIYLAAGHYVTILAFMAAVLGQVGVTIERWLFFAEAEHVVMLYYGKDKVHG